MKRRAKAEEKKGERKRENRVERVKLNLFLEVEQWGQWLPSGQNCGRVSQLIKEWMDTGFKLKGWGGDGVKVGESKGKVSGKWGKKREISQFLNLTAVHLRLGEYCKSLETKSTASAGILLWKTFKMRGN